MYRQVIGARARRQLAAELQVQVVVATSAADWADRIVKLATVAACLGRNDRVAFKPARRYRVSNWGAK